MSGADQYFQDETGQWYCLQRRKQFRKTDGGQVTAKLKVHPRICEHCGDEFINRHTSAKLCSNECSHASQVGKHKKDFVRTCEMCGATFERKIRGQKRKTCSHKCARALGDRSRGVPGELNHNWKGGKRLQSGSGYVLVYVAPGVTRLEHRCVMEEILSRPLRRFEEVHHKNAIRSDNRPENLELWVKRQPGGARAKDLIEYANWILETYGPLEDKL